MTDFFVGQVAIVIVAEHHNIFDVDPHRLEQSRVVPAEWRIRESTMSPLQASITYANGVTIEATPVRLTISDIADLGDVTDIALGYIKAFPRLAYRELGLNIQMGARVADTPHQWLTSQVKAAEAIDSSVARITLRGSLTEDILVQIDINSGVVQRESAESEEQVVILDFNIHHPRGLTAEGLCEAIEAWPSHAEALDDTVKKLMGDMTIDS